MVCGIEIVASFCKVFRFRCLKKIPISESEKVCTRQAFGIATRSSCPHDIASPYVHI